MCLNLLRGENINLHEHFKSHTITALFWPHLQSVYTGVGLQHMLQLPLSYTSINETGTRNLVKISLLKTSILNKFNERKNKARQSLTFKSCVLASVWKDKGTQQFVSLLRASESVD